MKSRKVSKGKNKPTAKKKTEKKGSAKKKQEKPAEPVEKNQEPEKNIEEIVEAESEKDFEEESFEEFIPRMEIISSGTPVLQRVETPISGENLEVNLASTPATRTDNQEQGGVRYPEERSDALGYSSFTQQNTDERKYKSESRVSLTPIRENIRMPRQELINPFFDMPDDNLQADIAGEALGNHIEERKVLPFKKDDRRYREYKPRTGG